MKTRAYDIFLIGFLLIKAFLFIMSSSNRAKMKDDPVLRNLKVESKIGMRLFTGERDFRNGGLPCVSCHSAGILKRNLSLYITRKKGRNLVNANPDLIVAAWINSPMGAMGPIYSAKPVTEEEIHAIREFIMVLKKNADNHDSDWIGSDRKTCIYSETQQKYK